VSCSGWYTCGKGWLSDFYDDGFSDDFWRGRCARKAASSKAQKGYAANDDGTDNAYHDYAAVGHLAVVGCLHRLYLCHYTDLLGPHGAVGAV